MKTQMFYQDGAWFALDSNQFSSRCFKIKNQRITKAMQLGLTPNEARRKDNKLMLSRLTISASNTCSPE